MSADSPWPDKISATPAGLTLVWSDGLEASLAWGRLRDRCPCATCKVKREQPPAAAGLFPVLTLEEAQPIKALRLVPVGNYAYGIHFNDGHATGIFSLKLLRELSEEVGVTGVREGT